MDVVMNRRINVYLFLLLDSVLIHISSQTTYTCSPTPSGGCSAKSDISIKIVGGETAASQTWGWAASLRYRSTGSHFCGGSIISPLHILTAAHCATALSSPSAVRVYVGSIYLSSMTQSRDVSLIHIHPDYSSSTYVNDISILKLSSPLDIDQSNVDIVCLPNVSSIVLASGEYPAANISLVAIGWGVTSETSNTVSSTLQQVTIQSIADNSIYCQNVELANPSTQFCAGIMPGGGKDTCQGDSGGSLLMCNSDNVWELVGITSNGVGCARTLLPGVYTRVAAYQSWINATMNSANHVSIISHRIFIPLIFIIFF